MVADRLPNFGMVSKGRLYRSAQPTSPQLLFAQRRYGIRTVLSLRLVDDDTALCRERRLRLLRMRTSEFTLGETAIRRFLRYALDPSVYPLLVHCRRGADRTGTMVAAYRIAVQGWSVEDAIAEARRFGMSPLYPWLPARLRQIDWVTLRKDLGLSSR